MPVVFGEGERDISSLPGRLDSVHLENGGGSASLDGRAGSGISKHSVFLGIIIDTIYIIPSNIINVI